MGIEYVGKARNKGRIRGNEKEEKVPRGKEMEKRSRL